MAKKIITAGLDLNDTDISLCIEGQGLVLIEPARIACEINSQEPVLFGRDALDISKKMPGAYTLTSPIFNGHITDPEGIVPVLTNMFEAVGINRKTEIIVALPYDISDQEKQIAATAILSAGAGYVGQINTVQACALGCGIDPFDEGYHIIVRCGMGSCDISLLKGCVRKFTKSIPYGVNKLNININTVLQNHFNVRFETDVVCKISETLADLSQNNIEPMFLNALDTVTRLPIKIKIEQAMVTDAIKDIIAYIGKYTKAVVDTLPDESRQSVEQNAVLICGEGAFIPGFADVVAEQTGLKCEVAAAPIDCIIDGLGVVVENRALLDPIVKSL